MVARDIIPEYFLVVYTFISLGCSGSGDVTSAPFFSEHHTLSKRVGGDYTESEFDRSSQGTDDYKSVGGEYTTVVHSDQHRHLESAPRAGSMAAHIAKSILSPWLYVFLLFGNFVVFWWLWMITVRKSRILYSARGLKCFCQIRPTIGAHLKS